MVHRSRTFEISKDNKIASLVQNIKHFFWIVWFWLIGGVALVRRSTELPCLVFTATPLSLSPQQNVSSTVQCLPNLVSHPPSWSHLGDCVLAHSTALKYKYVQCTVLNNTTLHCTEMQALHYTALQCTVARAVYHVCPLLRVPNLFSVTLPPLGAGDGILWALTLHYTQWFRATIGPISDFLKFSLFLSFIIFIDSMWPLQLYYEL